MKHYLNEYMTALGISTRKLSEMTRLDRIRLLRMRSNPEYRIDAAVAIIIAGALGITVEELYQKPGGVDGEN